MRRTTTRRRFRCGRSRDLLVSALVAGGILAAPCVADDADGPSIEAGDDSIRRVAIEGFGELVAHETGRSAYAWEGRLRDGRSGTLWEIPTSLGTVMVARTDDGRLVHSLPGGAGDRRTIVGPAPEQGCLGAIPVDEPPGPDQGGVAGGCDDGGTLDVLLKWTPTAASEAGGDVAIRALAESAVAISNHVYAMSGVSLRMRAVGFGVTEAYSGDAGGDVLSQLRVQGDGQLDSVHAERDAVGADLVALIIGQNPNYCGVAYILGGNWPGYGFSVTVWSCALGNLTFTHEIGHNQGCCHAPGDGGGCTSGGYYQYAVGHRFVGDSGTQWRTVMAYSPGTRWPRLSNPDVLHDGQPTGVPGSSGADNARTLDETAVTMANYRCSVVPDDGSAVHLISPTLDVPVDGASTTFEVSGLPTAETGTDVTFTLVAVADLGGGDETLTVSAGGVDLGVLIGGTGADCRPASGDAVVSAEVFNGMLEGGAVSVTVTSTAAVDPICDATEMRFTARYVAGPACGGADADGDGTPDLCDGCPSDPLKTEAGACGCGVADTDSDGDGTPDCTDGCPSDPLKTEAGACGCGVADTDSDGDGTPDCTDGCPSDPDKTSPGACGCGVAEIDSDEDGTPDCNDGCPSDPNKISPGACGCGVAETDSDGDGTPDCTDGCPSDPNKTSPGTCGCGVAETDSDGDGTPDCTDGCPSDPLKTEVGICGCGVDDATATNWWPDADGDGYGAIDGEPVLACVQPAGRVDNGIDCDDADSNVNPAAAEACGNAVDENCDGTLDDGCAAPVEFLGWTAATSTVALDGGGYVGLVDLYATFDSDSVEVVNVFNAVVSNSQQVPFRQNDLATVGGGAGTWAATQSIELPELGITATTDSFVLIGGTPGGTSTATLDPDFAETTEDGLLAVRGGWYNSNPANLQGLTDASGNLFVGRFAIELGASIDTLSVAGSVSFAAYPDGVTQQESATATIDWPARPCPEDLDGDGDVDGADIGILLLAWNTADAAADLDGDGDVDGADIGILLLAWGPCF